MSCHVKTNNSLYKHLKISHKVVTRVKLQHLCIMKTYCVLVFAVCVACAWSAEIRSRLSQARRQADEEAAAAEDAPAPAAPPVAAAPPAPRPQASSPVAQRAPGADTTAYVLPDGAELVVGSIKTTFSCANRIYGYYADPDNNCQVFHVCVHHLDVENGLDQTVQYSFFCGNQTVFDQETLVCVHPDDAVPCGEAASKYDAINSKFGITDRPPVPRAAGDEPGDGSKIEEKSTEGLEKKLEISTTIV